MSKHNRLQSAQNDVHAANDKQAQYLLEEITRKFDEQNNQQRNKRMIYEFEKETIMKSENDKEPIIRIGFYTSKGKCELNYRDEKTAEGALSALFSVGFEPIETRLYQDESTFEKRIVLNNKSEKIGTWILRHGVYYCSQCESPNYNMAEYEFYCPNCGAKMLIKKEGDSG